MPTTTTSLFFIVAAIIGTHTGEFTRVFEVITAVSASTPRGRANKIVINSEPKTITAWNSNTKRLCCQLIDDRSAIVAITKQNTQMIYIPASQLLSQLRTLFDKVISSDSVVIVRISATIEIPDSPPTTVPTPTEIPITTSDTPNTLSSCRIVYC